MSIVATFNSDSGNTWWSILFYHENGRGYRVGPAVNSFREVISTIPSLKELWPHLDNKLYCDYGTTVNYELIDMTDDLAVITAILKYS